VAWRQKGSTDASPFTWPSSHALGAKAPRHAAAFRDHRRRGDRERGGLRDDRRRAARSGTWRCARQRDDRPGRLVGVGRELGHRNLGLADVRCRIGRLWQLGRSWVILRRHARHVGRVMMRARLRSMREPGCAGPGDDPPGAPRRADPGGRPSGAPR